MSEHSFLIRLSDIRGEIAGVRDLTKGATPETFASSWAMTRAVQHTLLIIAEAAKHIPEEYKASHIDVPLAENPWSWKPAASRVSQD